VQDLIAFHSRPEVGSDVISGTADQDVGMDVCANFGDSRLKPSEASFSAPFRTSVTSDRKYMVTSFLVELWTPRAQRFL